MKTLSFVLLDPPATITLSEACSGILTMHGQVGPENEDLKHCWKAVYGYIVRVAMAKLEDDARRPAYVQDIVQESARRLMHGIEQLQHTNETIESPKSYISKIVSRVIPDYRRRMLLPLSYKARNENSESQAPPKAVEISEVEKDLQVLPKRDIEAEVTGHCRRLAENGQISARDAQLFCAVLQAGALEKGTKTGKSLLAKEFSVSPARLTQIIERVRRLVARELASA